MCRLAIFGGIEKERPLRTALQQLENSMGGHGNGYWDTEFQEVVKGVELLPEDIAEMAYDQRGIHLFHTRLATAGGTKDELNHPFQGDEWTVMHNGHWYDWSRFAEYEMSDTQTAARIVDEKGPGVLLNREFDDSGVWICARGDEVYVVSRSSFRNFVFQKLKAGGFFHASERIRNFAMDATMVAEEGEFYRVFNNGTIIVVDFPKVSMPEPMWEEEWWKHYQDSYGYGSLTSGYSYATKYDDSFDERKWWEKESWGDEDYEDGLLGIRKTPYDASSADDDLVIELPEESNWEQYIGSLTPKAGTKARTNVVPMSRALPAATPADEE